MVSTAQIQLQFACSEDLDHPLPLDFRSTCMRYVQTHFPLLIPLAVLLSRLPEDEEVAMRMCFSGFCADFRSHPKLSEKAEVEANSIAANRFNRVFEVVDLRLLKEIRSKVFNGVVDALKDYIQGMGGVGKIQV
ncbi:hypothetical protein GQ457_18G004270 [Hibiscus cannabinus]